MSDIAAEPEYTPLPEELWNPATWRERAEALLATWRSAGASAQITPEQGNEYSHLQCAWRASSLLQHWRNQSLAREMQQEWDGHPSDSKTEIEALLNDWRTLDLLNRIDSFLVLRSLNRRRVRFHRCTRKARERQQRADRKIAALLEQWRRLSYKDRVESYHYLRDLNDAREAAAKESKRNHRS